MADRLLRDGTAVARTRPARSPEDWALPDLEVATACLGSEYWSLEYPPALSPIGSVFTDIGCDRQCDFCQTPNYRPELKILLFIGWPRPAIIENGHRQRP